MTEQVKCQYTKVTVTVPNVFIKLLHVPDYTSSVHFTVISWAALINVYTKINNLSNPITDHGFN